MYSVIRDAFGRASIHDGVRTIPVDPANRHFQAFQAWNAAQPAPLDYADGPASLPPPVKDRAALAAAFMQSAPTPEGRSPLWDDVVGDVLLDHAEQRPDQVQAILDARGVTFSVREEG